MDGNWRTNGNRLSITIEGLNLSNRWFPYGTWTYDLSGNSLTMEEGRNILIYLRVE